MRLRRKIYIAVLSILLILLIGGFLAVKNAGTIAKDRLEHALGEGFSVEKIDLHWRSIDVFNAAFRKPDGTLALKVDHIRVSLNLLGILKKDYSLSEVNIENPYVLVETNSKGGYINPFPKSTKASSGEAPLVIISRLVIHKGSIDYLDRKVSRQGFLTKIRDIDFKMENISSSLPDKFSPFYFKAGVQGPRRTGSIDAKGDINLKNRDTKGVFNIRNLDITGFKPYFQGKGDVNITRGELDINMEASVKQNVIRAPGTATLRNLEFQSSGTFRDRFLGVPRAAVIGFLKNNRGEITFKFLIEGDIGNPRFSLRENFAQRLVAGLSEKLGISPPKITETIIKEGIKKGIGKGLGIFR